MTQEHFPNVITATKQSKLKRFIALAALFLPATLLVACGSREFEWKEEVLLQSGEIIKVQRSAKAKEFGEIGGPGGWENEGMTLRIAEPQKEDNPPEWSGKYVPILFDRDQKTKEWFLVVSFYTCQSWYALGKPALPYAEYRLKNGKWVQGVISPDFIGRSANMLTSIRSGGEPDHTVASKLAAESDVRIAPKFKNIVDHWSTGC